MEPPVVIHHLEEVLPQYLLIVLPPGLVTIEGVMWCAQKLNSRISNKTSIPAITEHLLGSNKGKASEYSILVIGEVNENGNFSGVRHVPETGQVEGFELPYGHGFINQAFVLEKR